MVKDQVTMPKATMPRATMLKVKVKTLMATKPRVTRLVSVSALPRTAKTSSSVMEMLISSQMLSVKSSNILPISVLHAVTGMLTWNHTVLIMKKTTALLCGVSSPQTVKPLTPLLRI